VNSKGWPTILAQVLGNIICDTLRPDKDEDLRILATDLVKVLDELVALLKVAADFNDLLDVVIGGEFHRANVDLNKILQEVLGGS